MTSENAAPAGMPGVEEIARALISHFVEHTGFTTVEEDETKTRVSAYYGGVWVELRVYPIAHAIIALFAPILAEKERRIANFTRGLEEATETNVKLGMTWRAAAERAEARALAAEAALDAERERCAKIVEEYRTEIWGSVAPRFALSEAIRCAPAIRAQE